MSKILNLAWYSCFGCCCVCITCLKNQSIGGLPCWNIGRKLVVEYWLEAWKCRKIWWEFLRACCTYMSVPQMAECAEVGKVDTAQQLEYIDMIKLLTDGSVQNWNLWVYVIQSLKCRQCLGFQADKMMLLTLYCTANPSSLTHSVNQPTAEATRIRFIATAFLGSLTLVGARSISTFTLYTLH